MDALLICQRMLIATYIKMTHTTVVLRFERKISFQYFLFICECKSLSAVYAKFSIQLSIVIIVTSR